jgi:hypothetical protein
VNPTDLRFVCDRIAACRASLLEDDPIGDDARALVLLSGLAVDVMAAREAIDDDIAEGVETDYTVLGIADKQLRAALGLRDPNARIKDGLRMLGADALPRPDWQDRVLAKAKHPWWRKFTSALRWLSW